MYKSYVYLFSNYLVHFGGSQSAADFAGTFSLQVNRSSTSSSAVISSRLIKFGD